jgi:hypothetical protein
MLTQQHSERSIDFEMQRVESETLLSPRPSRVLGAWGSTGAWRSHSRRAYVANEQPGSRFEGKRSAPVWTTPTVGELQRTTPWAWLWCERCQHHAPLACAVAVILWGPDASPAHAAPPAGEKARPSSVRAGLAIILASTRFQQSPTKCVEQHWRRNGLPATRAFLTG